MVSSREWAESEWDAEQRGWMLALADYEATRCQGCGGDVHETFDVTNQFAWHVDAPWQCHRCAAIERGADAFTAAGGEPRPSHRWIPEKR